MIIDYFNFLLYTFVYFSHFLERTFRTKGENNWRKAPPWWSILRSMWYGCRTTFITGMGHSEHSFPSYHSVWFREGSGSGQFNPNEYGCFALAAGVEAVFAFYWGAKLWCLSLMLLRALFGQRARWKGDGNDWLLINSLDNWKLELPQNFSIVGTKKIASLRQFELGLWHLQSKVISNCYFSGPRNLYSKKFFMSNLYESGVWEMLS